MGKTIGIFIWVFLLGFLAVLGIMTIIGKQKYKDKDDSVDPDWVNKSIALYPETDVAHRYYFTNDKNFAQGYQLLDLNKNVVYECKLWYLNIAGTDDVDFINHINGYTSHHKIGHVKEKTNGDIVLRSSFTFDGEDVIGYVSARGYSHKLVFEGIAFKVYIYKNDQLVATLYSSNNGENFFGIDGPIVAEPTRNSFVIETSYKYLDEVIPYTMFFSRCKYGAEELSS